MNLKQKTWNLLTELIEDHESNLDLINEAKSRDYQVVDTHEENEIRYRLQALKTCRKIITGGTAHDTTT